MDTVGGFLRRSSIFTCFWLLVSCSIGKDSAISVHERATVEVGQEIAQTVDRDLAYFQKLAQANETDVIEDVLSPLSEIVFDDTRLNIDQKQSYSTLSQQRLIFFNGLLRRQVELGASSGALDSILRQTRRLSVSGGTLR